jgi:hypothetical protein
MAQPQNPKGAIFRLSDDFAVYNSLSKPLPQSIFPPRSTRFPSRGHHVRRTGTAALVSSPKTTFEP